jgi:hypothetical protein
LVEKRLVTGTVPLPTKAFAKRAVGVRADALFTGAWRTVDAIGSLQAGEFDG